MPPRRKLVVFVCLVTVGIFGIVWGGIYRPYSFEYDGPSMNPGLTSGQSVSVRGYTFRGVFPAPAARPGDVVVAWSPADGVLVMKRVLAVGGQRFSERAGVAFVDGRPIATGDVPCPDGLDLSPPRCWTESLGERSWVAVSDSPPFSGDGFDDDVYEEQTVPRGHLFLRGDNRSRSNDSTNPMFGFVPETSVVAIVQ